MFHTGLGYQIRLAELKSNNARLTWWVRLYWGLRLQWLRGKRQ